MALKRTNGVCGRRRCDDGSADAVVCGGEATGESPHRCVERDAQTRSAGTVGTVEAGAPRPLIRFEGAGGWGG